jgi:hypothetical protein
MRFKSLQDTSWRTMENPYIFAYKNIVRQKYIIFALILVDLFPCKIASNPHGYWSTLVSNTTVSTWLVQGNWSTPTALVIM